MNETLNSALDTLELMPQDKHADSSDPPRETGRKRKRKEQPRNEEKQKSPTKLKKPKKDDEKNEKLGGETHDVAINLQPSATEKTNDLGGVDSGEKVVDEVHTLENEPKQEQTADSLQDCVTTMRNDEPKNTTVIHKIEGLSDLIFHLKYLTQQANVPALPVSKKCEALPIRRQNEPKQVTTVFAQPYRGGFFSPYRR